MKDTTKRSILRWIHIIFGVTLIGYIYGPPEQVRPYAHFFQYIYFPVIVLTGILMWKGSAIRRLFSKKAG